MFETYALRPVKHDYRDYKNEKLYAKYKVKLLKIMCNNKEKIEQEK